MYSRILVPIDESRTAARGLREALRMAAGHVARVRVLHIVDESSLAMQLASDRKFDRMLKKMQEAGYRLLERARSEAQSRGVACDVELDVTHGGSIPDIIVNHVRTSGSDLVVMGTHGRRGLKRLAFGSNAEEVARFSPVPVLLVRSEAVSTARQRSRRPDPVDFILP